MLPRRSNQLMIPLMPGPFQFRLRAFHDPETFAGGWADLFAYACQLEAGDLVILHTPDPNGWIQLSETGFVSLELHTSEGLGSVQRYVVLERDWDRRLLILRVIPTPPGYAVK